MTTLREMMLAAQQGGPATVSAPATFAPLGARVTPGNLTSYYNIDLGNIVGEGAFSKVYRGQRRTDGAEVAVKVIEKATVQKLSYVLSEIDLLRRLQHPLIVELFDVFEDPEHIYIVMEYMGGGDLYDKITDEWPRGYPEDLAIPLIKKVVAVVAFLHSRGIIHRDLKPENILFVEPENDVEIRLTDFGMAKMFSDDSAVRTQCGSPTYVAPEILHAAGSYTQAVDMWSIGVITFVLLSGSWPFYDERTSELFDLIKAGQFSMPADPWDGITDEAKDFIRKLLVVEPKHRMSGAEALQHPWLKDVPPFITPGNEGEELPREAFDQ